MPHGIVYFPLTVMLVTLVLVLTVKKKKKS